MNFCAACSVSQGLCPNCGTFWIPARANAGKSYGVRPVDSNPWVATFGDTSGYGISLNSLFNVAQR